MLLFSFVVENSKLSSITSNYFPPKDIKGALVMKGKIILALVALFTTIKVHATIHSDDATSKTFFSFEPHYSTGRPEHLSSYRKRMLEKEDGYGGCFQAVVYGGETTSSAPFARYFFPGWKTSLVIAEGPNPLATDGGGVFIGGSGAFKADTYDLLAHNFNIETVQRNFKQNIFICPKQKFYGVAFNGKKSFFNNEDGGFWLDITIPIEHVDNDINLNETDKNSATALEGHPKSLTEAFNQCDWKYGKISPCGLSKTGVADVELRLGTDVLRKERYFYGSFVGLIIPTGNKPKAHFVFEPIVGRNHHWGILWGSSMSFQLAAYEHSSVQTAFDVNSSYLFEANEVRSFDLKDKQWSRYINVFTDSHATTTSPGINTFTQSMKIRPRGTFQINSALIFTYKKFDCELGLYSYFRQSEEGRLACEWQEGPAIAGVSGATDITPAQSMNLATMHMWDYKIISQDVDYGNLNTDPTLNIPLYKTLKEEDLNLQSALHPNAIAGALYGALSYSWDTWDYPSFLGAGASYQFSSDNISSHRWSAWFKFGASF